MSLVEGLKELLTYWLERTFCHGAASPSMEDTAFSCLRVSRLIPTNNCLLLYPIALSLVE